MVPPAHTARQVPSRSESGVAPAAPLSSRPGGDGYRSPTMDRPRSFEHARYLGDKRTQLVYDLDEWEDGAVIDDIVAAGVGAAFGPDTLAEARNRGYSLARPGRRRLHRAPRS